MPAADVRRSGTLETGLRTVSARARVTRPIARTSRPTARPTHTGALSRQPFVARASLLDGSGASPSSSRTGLPARPAAAGGAGAELEPPRPLPVDPDELEGPCRARGAQRPLAVERELAHLERGEPRRRRGRKHEGEHGEEGEPSGHRGNQRDAARVLRQARRPSPHGMLTAPRAAPGCLAAVATVESSWTRASRERSGSSSRRPPRFSSHCRRRPRTHRACSSSSSTTTSTRSRRTSSRTRCTAPSARSSPRS